MSETAESKPRFTEGSAVGVLVGSLAVILTAILCGALRVDPTVAQAATAGAGAVPAVLALMANRRRRSPEDVARIRSGQQERPIGLIVLIAAAALLIYDTLAGVIIGTMLGLPLIPLILTLASAIPVFFAATWVSRYLGSRPYLWMSVIIAVAFVMRAFIIITILPSLDGGDLVGAALGLAFVYFLLLLAVALAGTWYGRRRSGDVVARQPVAGAAPSARPSAASAPIIAPIPFALTAGQDASSSAATVVPASVSEPIPVAQPTAPHPSPTPPAGWYPDPDLRGVERWWDGAQWTDYRRNTP